MRRAEPQPGRRWIGANERSPIVASTPRLGLRVRLTVTRRGQAADGPSGVRYRFGRASSAVASPMPTRQVSLVRLLIGRLLGARALPSHSLGGFLDRLLQSFEDCRQGLSDAVLAKGGPEVERFFLERYEKETPRLREQIELEASWLTPAGRERLRGEVDDLVRRVLIPAYARLAVRFTARERNDFYLLPEALAGFERVGFALVGMLVGVFVVWAPFIPLWSKEWVLPFVVGGLFYPNLRRFLAIRRYEAELNLLVGRGDREIERLESAYLTGSEALGDRVPGMRQGSAEAEADAATPIRRVRE